MSKKNKILNGVLVIADAIIMLYITRIGWVNRMPSYPERMSAIDDILDLFLGKGLSTLILAVIITIISFVISKFSLKEKTKARVYIILFGIMAILNIFIHRVFVRIVY